MSPGASTDFAEYYSFQYSEYLRNIKKISASRRVFNITKIPHDALFLRCLRLMEQLPKIDLTSWSGVLFNRRLKRTLNLSRTTPPSMYLIAGCHSCSLLCFRENQYERSMRGIGHNFLLQTLHPLFEDVIRNKMK